jgi:hypothetical protein
MIATPASANAATTSGQRRNAGLWYRPIPEAIGAAFGSCRCRQSQGQRFRTMVLGLLDEEVLGAVPIDAYRWRAPPAAPPPTPARMTPAPARHVPCGAGPVDTRDNAITDSPRRRRREWTCPTCRAAGTIRLAGHPTRHRTTPATRTPLPSA